MLVGYLHYDGFEAHALLDNSVHLSGVAQLPSMTRQNVAEQVVLDLMLQIRPRIVVRAFVGEQLVHDNLQFGLILRRIDEMPHFSQSRQTLPTSTCVK